MAKWSRVQIEVMARAAGWGARSKDASYVAMAESSGDDKIVNSIGCVGLLQINQPVHVGSHPKWTRAWLQNPMNNLAAGLVLYKASGWSPWADSKDKGGGGGWGQYVAGSGSTGVTPVDDDPCGLLKGPAKDQCLAAQNGQDGVPNLGDTAAQIGRLAQALAKAGNWTANPQNWVRIAYVVGGGLLALTAVSVIVRPYADRAYRDVRRALPIQTTKDVARQLRPNPE